MDGCVVILHILLKDFQMYNWNKFLVTLDKRQYEKSYWQMVHVGFDNANAIGTLCITSSRIDNLLINV